MNPNPPLFDVPQQISKVSGPALLIALLNSGLLGVLSVQVFLYYIAFPNDRVYLKGLVYGLYILEFVQSALIIDNAFPVYVTGFGVFEGSDKVGTGWLSIPIFTAIGTFVVQGFYAHRISILSQSKKVTSAIITLSFIQLGGGIALGVHTERTKYYSLLNSPEKLTTTQTTIGIWNVGSILCDIIIAGCMTYYLSRYDTTIKATKTLVKKIIRLTIETGSLTAVTAIVCFSLAMSPGQYYYQVPMCLLGKVYANSMLILLNSRMIIGSEEMPSTIISGLRFNVVPANTKAGTIEAHHWHQDLSADTTETWAGPSRGSEPEVTYRTISTVGSYNA